MGRRKKRKKQKNRPNPKKTSIIKRINQSLLGIFIFLRKQISNLPSKLKRYLLSALMFLISLISGLSFFGLSGQGGNILKDFFFYWISHATYFVPFIFIIFGIIFLRVVKKLFFAAILAGLVFLLGISGILSLQRFTVMSGGKIGDLLSNFLARSFGDLVASSVFLIFIVFGLLAFRHLFSSGFRAEKEKATIISQVIKRVRGLPKFQVSQIEAEEREIKTEKMSPILEKSDLQKSRTFKFASPPLGLLVEEKEKAHSGNIRQNSAIIKKTLENFGIEVAMAQVNIGPTVTQYTFKPAEGVRLSKITALNKNLAMALAAHPIRIEAPIPGQSLVGVEIPNKIRSKVRLRNLFASPERKEISSNLGFALGRDVAGNPLFGDLTRLPHLLVAGATGTGKTIFLNSLILSLLYQNSPETLRLIFVDPKRVEFPVYDDIPHKAFPVVFDANRAVRALQWLVHEMERRFEILSEQKAKDIISFNGIMASRKDKPLPYIVLIIDELADLMAAKGKEVEAPIIRIAQMARAVGIHLVLATQRPSVEVITGLIKANITSRVSFQVASQFDARTVLDMAGAEKLLGAGDMLYVSADSVHPKRIQGAFASENEVRKVVAWIKENVIPEAPEQDMFTKSFQDFEDKSASSKGGGQKFDDPLYEDAKTIVINAGRASASLLQRRLSIGYARAARLLDTMEAEDIIGPPRGPGKDREVFSESQYQEEETWE